MDAEKLLYMGKPIEDYPKEALIALIRGLMAQLEGSRAAMRTLNEISELRRHRVG